MGIETQQLSDIAEIGRLFDRAGIAHWLFGGWAVDFYVGEVTRPHEDIDLALWLNDLSAADELLSSHGWQHCPQPDEDGGTGYEHNGVRVELTLLVEGDHGEVLIAFRTGRVMWSSTPFGSEVRTLDGAQARVIPLGLLRERKVGPERRPGRRGARPSGLRGALEASGRSGGRVAAGPGLANVLEEDDPLPIVS